MIPGLLGNGVSNDGDLMRMIADLDRRITQLAAANPLAPAGLSVQPNQLTVNGNLAVVGSETVSGSLNVTGTMTASNASITGTLAESNGYGTMSAGPIVYLNGGPGVTFSKAGSTYLNPCGVGLYPSVGRPGTDAVQVAGPSPAGDYAFLSLYSDGSTFFGSSTSGPNYSTSAGANGVTYVRGGQTNGSISISPAGTGNCQVNGNFAVSGTKAFIMPHPVDPAKNLMHAATESDCNGVEYWGTATVRADGMATVRLPDYFEALTKADGRAVILTGQGRNPGTLGYDPITAGAFTVYGTAGVTFSWLVKAVRHHIVDGYDALGFIVESDAVAFGPQLDEPAPAGG